MQIAEPALTPPIAPFRGEYHEVERSCLLDLQPALPACARRILSGRGFRHDSFVAPFQSSLEELFGFDRISCCQMWNKHVPRNKIAQSSKPLRLWFVNDRSAVEIQEIEPEWRERKLFTHSLDVKLAAESPHRDLKRLRPPCRIEAKDFSVENEVLCRQRPCCLNEFRNRGRDIVQPARINDNVVAGLVQLDAGSVELVFQRRLAQVSERALDVLSGLRNIGCTGRNS